jgi:DNA polymerase-1
VYLENFDGHCLKAFSYFPERLPGIQNTVESINSIKRRFPDVRQDSKGPTFALTYQGTWITLVRNLGFSEAKAKEIEKAYHALYRVSDKWVQDKLDQAAKDGYVEVAFGLRVRTPLLSQTLRGHRTTPFQADAEGRTAGNALGQSYGLLNNRAANAFMKKVWASKYAHDILPIAQIHDASYYLIRDSVSVVEFVNNALIKEMQWQELPELQHDIVKLGAEMDVFWPSWATPITLPNNASTDAIRELCEERIKEQLAA